MTDPNHIELLREIRRVYGGTEAIAALDAAITALSARASAGEGGSPEVVVRRDERGAIVAVEVNGRVIASNAEWLAAAPQPAQAGASGGGEWEIAEIMRGCLSAIEGGRDPRYGFSIGPSIEGIEEAAKRIAAMLATPASPATGEDDVRLCHCCGETFDRCRETYRGDSGEWDDGVKACIAWVEKRRHDFESEYGMVDPSTGAMEFRSVAKEEYDCELGEIEEGLRSLLAAAPQPQPQPQDHIADADKIMVTPPAHGDGEGDAFEAWAASQNYDMTKHPLHWLFLNERTYAARQGWKAGMEYALTTRPTPEAQEARDAARYRLLRDRSVDDYGSCRIAFTWSCPLQRVEGHDPVDNAKFALDAAVDAALALPAQGEGES